MIRKLRIYESNCFDPHKNLAIETLLMQTTPEDTCTLYLWQNQNTVVIGRNQNAWAECRTSLLQQENGVLARRLSGGGAVFHDLGNLNFTFLMAKDNYNLDRQLQVIQRACALAGIQAEKSGRNDLLAEGRKFSGNAFYQNATHAYHHGTLMVDVDKDKLGRYLSPPKAKLEAKGIASVRSRVVNLQELAPTLTIARLKSFMRQAFQEVYDAPCTPVVLTEAEEADILQLQGQYSSWDFLYGSALSFTFQCEDRFSWGSIQLQLEAKSGQITAAKVYTDAMQWELSGKVQQALTGCKFQLQAMKDSIMQALENGEIAEDLCTLLDAQQL